MSKQRIVNWTACGLVVLTVLAGALAICSEQPVSIFTELARTVIVPSIGGLFLAAWLLPARDER